VSASSVPVLGATPKRLTLRFGLSTAFVTMVLSTAVVICGLLLTRMHDIMRADLRQRMRDVASMAAMDLSGDTHRQIRGREDEGTPTFLALKRHMQAVKAAVPELRFAYTIKRAADGSMAFWIDAETDAEGSHVGDEVTVVTETLKLAFQAPTQPYVEPEFYADKWGTWLSGYAPVFASDGTLECLVGVDISAAKVAEAEWAAIRVLLLIAGAITLIVAVIGLWLSNRIVHPMAVLEANMANVRELRLDGSVEIRSRFHEIVRMAETLSAMKSGLRSFSKYVPTELVRELIHDGAEAHLGARRAELTIFFSDIEGFTTIAESTTPEGLAADLADYFATITGTILESGGTVDKYIGDCVMAFWGAPRAVPDHAARAVETSLRVRSRLAELNARRATEGRPPIVTRIGLSTGEVVVGNFGYEARMNYTVMGDTVNLASRLEGLNKYVGTMLLVSESTMAAANGAILGRLLGAVAVKGKREGVRIWEPVAMRAEADATLVGRVGEWNAAVERFMAQEFEAALPVFEAWAARHPDDEPASQKIEACRQFISLPPEPTWNGTVVMNTK
jgi:adenylate cyclase